MKISRLEIKSQKALELNRLLNIEWPNLGEFRATELGLKVPGPIVAIEKQELIGGLSFTCYKEPDGEEIVVWVNALLVIPSFRFQGIASKLILASHCSANCLYALTDIPVLYTKVGWQVVKKDSNGTVVKYAKNT